MLPGFVKKLISGYELRCFHFEIFESFRKLALVGAPIAFPPGRASPVSYYYFILLLHSPITTKSYYSLLTTHYSLLTTYYLLLTTYYLLLTTYYLLLTTHYSLLTTHYLLLTAATT